MSTTWIRYFDEGYNAFYLYNDTTGESLWEEDCDKDGMHIVDGSQQEIPPTEVPTSAASITNRMMHTEVNNEEDAVFIKRKPKTFRSSDFAREPPPLTHEQRSEFDLLCYTRFMFINAIFVEAPLSVIEGAIRISLLSLACLFKLCYSAYNRARVSSQPEGTSTWSYLREILLTAAAMLTLAVPGGICFVYKGFSYENDWELNPLPTILGTVDCRRFAVITFGAGALATNSGAANAAQHHHIHDTNPVQSNSITRIGQGHDGWSGTVIWVPREVLRDVAHFIAGGDNHIDSLNIAL